MATPLPSHSGREHQRAELITAAIGLVSVLALGWFTVWVRADPTQPSLWWLASGVAIGVGCRLPRHYLWPYSLATGVVLYGVFLVNFGSTPAAIAASVGTVLETVTAIEILRAGRSGPPALRQTRDLGRLLIAVLASATVFDLILLLGLLLSGQPEAAVFQLASAGPRHAAGALLLVPFALVLPDAEKPSSRADAAIQVGIGLIVAALVFVGTKELPLAFVALAPPVWSAFSIPLRWVLMELLGISLLAAYGSAINRGPFAFEAFGRAGASALIQLFELITISVTLMLALTVARERSVTAKLEASELTYRRNFENSLAGMIMIARDADSWQVIGHNRAAGALLPHVKEGPQALDALVGTQPAATITAAVESLEASEKGIEVALSDGRYLQVSVVGLELDTTDTYALQILDVTDTVLVQRRVADELNRAREVQRALAPSEQPPRRGWTHGALMVTARQVGGDFYDLRISGSQAIMTLGDVMGKGIGAGILAAAARTSLRASNTYLRSSEVLAEAARVIDDDLAKSGAFVTVGYAVVDLLSGRVNLSDAGHGLTFAIRGDSHKVHRLASEDLPLGLGEHWETLNTQLAPGDSLLMVSDGVLELWGDSIEELTNAIALICFDPHGTGPQHLVDALCTGGDISLIRTDDATAVLLHRERESS